jgi:hypothetical protein
VLTPANIKVEQEAGFRVFTAPGSGFFSVEKEPLRYAHRRCSGSIYFSELRAAFPRWWQRGMEEQQEIVDGRELLRFESKMGGKPPKGNVISDTETSRLTVPGYRYRIWRTRTRCAS